MYCGHPQAKTKGEFMVQEGATTKVSGVRELLCKEKT
jgi:hypothetical protein